MFLYRYLSIYRIVIIKSLYCCFIFNMERKPLLYTDESFLLLSEYKFSWYSTYIILQNLSGEIMSVYLLGEKEHLLYLPAAFFL